MKTEKLKNELLKRAHIIDTIQPAFLSSLRVNQKRFNDNQKILELKQTKDEVFNKQQDT